MADRSSTVKIEILGDAANAVSAFSKMEESGDKLEQSVGKNHENIKGSGDKLESSLSKNAEGVSNFAAEAVKKLAELAAAGEALHQVGEAVSAAEELGQATLVLTRETGLGAESASALLAAMERYGIDGEEASKSLGNFSKQIEGSALNAEHLQGGLSDSSDRLKQLGIAVIGVDGNTRPMEQILGDVADRFQAMPDGADKTATAMQLFGKAGKDMIPILDGGRAGLQDLEDESKKLGLTLSGDNVAQIEKYRLAQVSMNEAIGGVKLQLGVALMPLLTELATRVTEAAEAFNTKAVPAIKQFGNIIGTVFGDITSGNFGGAIDALFGGIITKVEDVAGNMLGAGENVTKTFAQGLINGTETYVSQAVNYVAGYIADFFIGHSPPPVGPLSTIDEGGRTLGKTYVEGMADGFSGVGDVAAGVSDTLTAGMQKFQDAGGNLDALTNAADYAGDAIQKLSHAINDIDAAELPIKEHVQDITDTYTAQIDPLQRQLDLIKQKVDYSQQEKEANLDLQDIELQRQENALKPQATAIDKSVSDLEKQLKAVGKGAPDNSGSIASLEAQQKALDKSAPDHTAALADLEKQLKDVGANGPDTTDEQTALTRQIRDLGNGADTTDQRAALTKQLNALKDAAADQAEADKKKKAAIQDRIDALKAEDAAAKASIDKQKAAIQDHIDQLKAADAQEKKNEQTQKDGIQAQIDALKDKKDGLDANLKAQRDAIAVQKESLTLDDQKVAIQDKLAEMPLVQRIEDLKNKEKDALDPLKASLALMDERKARIDLERQRWNLLKTDITDAEAPIKKANSDAAAADALAKKNAAAAAADAKKLTMPDGTQFNTKGGPSGEGAATQEAMKTAGTKAAGAFVDSVKKFIEDHIGHFVASGIGSALGGAVLGPVGAVVGGLLGGFIGTAVQKKLKESGVNFSDVAKAWGEKLKALGDYVQTTVFPALLRFGEFVKTNIIPPWQQAVTVFREDAIPALKQLGEGIINTVLPALAALGYWIVAVGMPNFLQLEAILIGKVIPAIGSLADWITSTAIPAVEDFATKAVTLFGQVSAWVESDLIPTLQKFADWFQAVAVPALQAFAGMVTAFFQQNIIPAIRALVTFLLVDFWPKVSQVINDVVTLFKSMADASGIHWGDIKTVVAAVLGFIVLAIQTQWNVVKGLTEAVWLAVSGIIKGALDVISGLFEFWQGVFSGDWGKAWDGIKDAYGGVWEAIKGILDAALKVIQTALSTAWGLIGGEVTKVWGGIKDDLGKFLGLIRLLITDQIGKAKSDLEVLWSDISKKAGDVWDALKTALTTTLGLIKDAITTPIDAAKDALSGIWTTIKDDAGKAWDALQTKFDGAKQGLKDTLLWPFEQMRDALSGIMGTAESNAKGPINAVIGGLNTVGDAVAGALRFIGDKLDVGSLKGINFPHLPGFATGVQNFSGGYAIVGEKGPEIVKLPKGADVIPNAETIGLLKGQQMGFKGLGAGPLDLGKSLVSGAKDAISTVYDSVSSIASKGADWILSQAFKVGNLNMPGAFSGLGSGIISTAKDGLLELIKGALSGIKDIGGTFPGGNAVLDMARQTAGVYMWCEKFVGDVMQRLGLRYARAGTAQEHSQMQPLQPGTGPAGAVVFLPWGDLGHVAFSMGDGKHIYGTANTATGTGVIDAWGGAGWTVNPAANGAYVKRPTLLLSGEGGDKEGEITSPVQMMRKVMQEELQASSLKTPHITQHISGMMPGQVTIETKKALRSMVLERRIA